jgi:uncharacterized protein
MVIYQAVHPLIVHYWKTNLHYCTSIDIGHMLIIPLHIFYCQAILEFIKKVDILWAYAENNYMSRPKKHRNIRSKPGYYFFKPIGVPIDDLEEVVLNVDEIEAVRLADLNRLYHKAGAVEMKISRATFGRILSKARTKIADALIQGKALKIGPLTEKS